MQLSRFHSFPPIESHTMLSRTCLTRTPLRIVSHRFVSSSSTVPLPKLTGPPPPHLLTLADLPIAKIQTLVSSAIAFKKHYKSNAIPLAGRTLDESSEPGSLGETMVGAPLSGMGAGMAVGEDPVPMLALKSLDHKTVALMFNKRSTRTRVASESAVHMLGSSTTSHHPVRADRDSCRVQEVIRCFLERPTFSWE